MTVSLIVGMLRTLAEFTAQPAEILAGLNRRLYGRLHGGFVTCLVMLLHADGSCVLASAGHPPPFVNQKEVALPGALPLGLVAETAYEQITVPLQEGDHLVLYTDGLLEARAAGWRTLQLRSAEQPDAAKAQRRAGHQSRYRLSGRRTTSPYSPSPAWLREKWRPLRSRRRSWLPPDRLVHPPGSRRVEPAKNALPTGGRLAHLASHVMAKVQVPLARMLRRARSERCLGMEPGQDLEPGNRGSQCKGELFTRVSTVPQ